MSFLDSQADADIRAKTRTLLRLLDLAFGFFVWSVHLLTIYVATAVVCVLGVGPRGQMLLAAALALVTVAAATAVIWHGLRRYRQPHDASEDRFRMAIAVGGDGIALVAIAWQLFPILLVPPCR